MGTESISEKSVLRAAIEQVVTLGEITCYLPMVRMAHDRLRQVVGMTRDQLPLVMRTLGYTCGAEIGVLRGAYSQVICSTIPDVKLICVDPWAPYREWTEGKTKSIERMEGHYTRARRRLRGHHVTFIREKSTEAVCKIPAKSLDFVYIDGLHEFDPVMVDLILWADKVRPGGMIAGHDYSPPAWHNGVMAAVDAYVEVHRVDEWFITDEEDKSYFWVKT